MKPGTVYDLKSHRSCLCECATIGQESYILSSVKKKKTYYELRHKDITFSNFKNSSFLQDKQSILKNKT